MPVFAEASLPGFPCFVWIESIVTNKSPVAGIPTLHRLQDWPVTIYPWFWRPPNLRNLLRQILRADAAAVDVLTRMPRRLAMSGWIDEAIVSRPVSGWSH